MDSNAEHKPLNPQYKWLIYCYNMEAVPCVGNESAAKEYTSLAACNSACEDLARRNPGVQFQPVMYGSIFVEPIPLEDRPITRDEAVAIIQKMNDKTSIKKLLNFLKANCN